ncbi:Transaldolase [bioreactor metagenome]|uniref:Transaldolase n=1 Tax=bioreactor metagenome TaxID=1076179 RepID=A0A645GUL9_9ZZZZ
MARELERLNVEVGQLDALLITHEHADHVAGAGILSRRHGLPIYATAGTWQSLPSKFGAIDPAFRRVIEPGQNFYIGAIDVMPFAIPHDAAQPVGYAFEGRGAKVAVATDLGCLSEKWIEPLAGCDLLTIAPSLLAELQATEGYLPRKLDTAKAASAAVDKITVDEATFARMHAADRMASEKLAEGIAGFTKALETLEAMLSARLKELEG